VYISVRGAVRVRVNACLYMREAMRGVFEVT